MLVSQRDREVSCDDMKYLLILTLVCMALMGCSSPLRNQGGPEADPSVTWARSKVDYEELRSRYPDHFLGVGEWAHQDADTARIFAKLIAEADLTKSIRIIVVHALMDVYRNGHEELDTILRLISEVRIRKVDYHELDAWKDAQGRHHIVILAVKSRQEYFNDYVDLIEFTDKDRVEVSDVLKELNEELSQRWSTYYQLLCSPSDFIHDPGRPLNVKSLKGK